MRKKIVFIFAICFTLFLVAGCNNNKDNEDNSINIGSIEQKKKINIIDENSNSRPYAVMINCHNASLPQAGLDKAYIVYEIMVEGGITRMMALFKDVDVNKIGSVRSARNQYLGYVMENDAVYIHAGGSPEALDRIRSGAVVDVDVDGTYGVRDKNLNRAWEHTLFTTTDLISKAMSSRNIKSTTDVPNLLTYSPDEVDLSKYEGSNVANNISIKYSGYRTSNYVYDETSETYLRSMNDTKNVDLVTNEQYKVKNIIIYGVDYETYTHSGYNGYQKINNIGTGEGYYVTNGYSIPIIWEKKDEKSQTIYKIKLTGEKLIVNDGNTYIQIYPNSGKLTIN